MLAKEISIHHLVLFIWKTRKFTVNPGSWRSEIEDKHSFINLQNVPRRSLNVAQSIRNEFQEYFILTEGSVS